MVQSSSGRGAGPTDHGESPSGGAPKAVAIDETGRWTGNDAQCEPRGERNAAAEGSAS